MSRLLSTIQNMANGRNADLSTALLGGKAGRADRDGATKMKLVLLKPGDGQGIKELLKSMEPVEGGTASSDAAATRCLHLIASCANVYCPCDNLVDTSAACHRNQQAAQQLLEQGGGEVVFEGDPASLSDVDSVAQAMLAAMGVPEVRSPCQTHIAYEA